MKNFTLRFALLIGFVFVLNYNSNACCGESSQRLFPLGEINKEVVFMEFKLSRKCKNGEGSGPKNEFWIDGVFNLVKYKAGKLEHIENIDTVSIRECVCKIRDYNEKSNLDSVLSVYYTKSIKRVSEMKGFKLGKTTSITFNDTTNTVTKEIDTDSTFSYTLAYKDIFKFDLAELGIISCYPDVVAEVRTYETENHDITILRLRCRLLKKDAIKRNRKRFKNIHKAYWIEELQWHGMSKDYHLIEEKM